MPFREPQWVTRIGSTNTELLDRLDAGEALADGHVLATTEQTAGRGRGTRHWHGEAGRDLCCSFVCRTTAPPRQLASLAMATALGLVGCLEGFGVQARTKWPNDVVVPGEGATGGAKIAGILCELRPGVAVVGIGLNVSMSSAEAARIDQPATSILIETGVVTAPHDVLPRLLDALTPCLSRWSQDGFAALRQDWSRKTIALGETVVIDDGESSKAGVLEGFGDAGQLLLRVGDASLVEIWSGHLRRA